MKMSLYDGLKKKAPKPPSEKPSGPSVNADPVRNAVAPTPKTIEGRVA